MKFAFSFGLFDSDNITPVQRMVMNINGNIVPFPINMKDIVTKQDCLEYVKSSIEDIWKHLEEQSINLNAYKQAVDFWSTEESRLYSYWNDIKLINRSKLLVNELKKYEFSSIYEIGVSNGRNLKYIYDDFPNIAMGGLDINQKAIEFARMILPTDVKLDVNDAMNININDKFDIVFTSSTLIHMPPVIINGIINNCIKKASKYIIHLENSEGNNYIVRGPKELNPEITSNEFEWYPDIARIYKDMGYEPMQEQVQLDGDRLMTITTIKL